MAEEECWKFLASLVGGIVGAAIGPFAQRRLDEALDLAVGLRGVGPRALVDDAEPSQSFGVATGFGRPIRRRSSSA